MQPIVHARSTVQGHLLATRGKWTCFIKCKQLGGSDDGVPFVRDDPSMDAVNGVGSAVVCMRFGVPWRNICHSVSPSTFDCLDSRSLGECLNLTRRLR